MTHIPLRAMSISPTTILYRAYHLSVTRKYFGHRKENLSRTQVREMSYKQIRTN